MFIEGKGYQPPKKYPVLFFTDEILEIRAKAKYFANNNRGKIENLFVGFLGEAALAKGFLSNLGEQSLWHADLYTDKNDGEVDIEIFGIYLQVKTHTKKNGNCTVSRGNKTSINRRNSDYYIFCEVDSDVTSNFIQRVYIEGYISATELEQFAIRRWNNDRQWLNIDRKYLYYIDRLFVLCNNKKEELKNAYTLPRQ